VNRPPDTSLPRLVAALGERYRIEGELGRGAMALIYRARDLRHDRTVAVKLLPPELASEEFAARFLREIRITAGLHHPHIMPLLDSGAEGGLCWYVMPYVEGESLRERLARERPVPVRDALKWAGQMAQALGYAHGRGIVHRDIKPANVLISGGQAMVLDFGLARALEGSSDRLTQAGMPLGTPAYMSPEQLRGEEPDGRADLYSLGCVLYEMVTGTTPFTGHVTQLLRALLTQAPDPPSRRAPGLPSRMDEVLGRLLEKDPARRYQTAEDLARELEILSAQALLGM
jgi:serine/threonine protein kinase